MGGMAIPEHGYITQPFPSNYGQKHYLVAIYTNWLHIQLWFWKDLSSRKLNPVATVAFSVAFSVALFKEALSKLALSQAFPDAS